MLLGDTVVNYHTPIIMLGGPEGWGWDTWAPTHCALCVFAQSPYPLKDHLGPLQSDVLRWGFPGGGGEGQGLMSSAQPQAQGENLPSQAGPQVA